MADGPTKAVPHVRTYPPAHAGGWLLLASLRAMSMLRLSIGIFCVLVCSSGILAQVIPMGGAGPQGLACSWIVFALLGVYCLGSFTMRVLAFFMEAATTIAAQQAPRPPRPAKAE